MNNSDINHNADMKKARNLKGRTILDLTAKEASQHLMQSKEYCSMELPEYFDFQPVLSHCNEAVKDGKLPTLPTDLEGVNLEMILNKDGHYGVRPITIANPYLYTALVQTLCAPEAWDALLDCFAAFRSDNIEVCSIPVLREDTEAFFNSTIILNWWKKMEQQPIELSLQYRYMFMTDITNCFGQILPQSIDWALSRRDTDKATDKNTQLASHIISLIRALQGGKSMGIPQGSILYNLIAEIVLGYSDMLLDRAIKKAGITVDYKILRYVDDYRIFCNDRSALEEISYLLQHTLEQLNFRMNTAKTKISDNIILNAVKPDKAYYIRNTPILNKQGVDFDGFQKHLNFIYQFGREYPNSGQLRVLLSDFNKRLTEYLNPSKDKSKAGCTIESWEDVDLGEEPQPAEAKSESKKSEESKSSVNFFNNLKTYGRKPVESVNIFNDLKTYRRKPMEKVLPMVAILVQIACENVSAAHCALSIISRLLLTLDKEEEKNHIIRLVYGRLRHLPNSSYLQLWLQMLTNPIDDPTINDYDTPLCKVVKTPQDELIDLWDNSWLHSATPLPSICDPEKQKESEGQPIKIVGGCPYACPDESLNIDASDFPQDDDINIDNIHIPDKDDIADSIVIAEF